jgi:NAD(P)-dependent dehydrogenase (short-subunit alcohol dehydrogenase family)
MSNAIGSKAEKQRPEKQNAVVTGASSGIGRAIAIALAQQRLSVCLVGRDPGRLEAAAREAGKTAPFVLPYRADVTDDGAILELSEVVKRKFGGIDVLVHCAVAYTRRVSRTLRLKSSIHSIEQMSTLLMLSPGVCCRR